MNRSDFINDNIQFGSNPNINELSNYLEKYRIITAKNGKFLIKNTDIKALLNELNKENSKRNKSRQLPPHSKKYQNQIYKIEREHGRYYSDKIQLEDENVQFIYDGRTFANINSLINVIKLIKQ